MKVNEIEFNDEVYRITPTQDDNYCKNCALKEHCGNTTQEGDFIYDICQEHIVKSNFQKINKRNTKFYRFSSGTMFNLNLLSDILFITFVEKYSPEHYGFTIILNKGNVEVGFKNTIAANRERNKFIKFIEEYETLD